MKRDNNEFNYGNLGMIFSVSMFLCFVEDPKTSKKFELLNLTYLLNFCVILNLLMTNEIIFDMYCKKMN